MTAVTPACLGALFAGYSNFNPFIFSLWEGRHGWPRAQCDISWNKGGRGQGCRGQQWEPRETFVSVEWGLHQQWVQQGSTARRRGSSRHRVEVEPSLAFSSRAQNQQRRRSCTQGVVGPKPGLEGLWHCCELTLEQPRRFLILHTYSPGPDLGSAPY